MSDAPKLTRLAKRMRDKKQALCFGYGRDGARIYWLEPSQKRVKEEAALRAIAHPLVVPNDTGLFGDAPQSYRVVEA